jgi:hypothetical protein
MKFLLNLLVALHMAVIFGILVSFCVLPFKADWYVALPLMVYILSLLFTRVECPLTNLENKVRQKLGMKRIGGFVGHYIVKHIKVKLGIKRK